MKREKRIDEKGGKERKKEGVGGGKKGKEEGRTAGRKGGRQDGGREGRREGRREERRENYPHGLIPAVPQYFFCKWPVSREDKVTYNN